MTPCLRPLLRLPVPSLAVVASLLLGVPASGQDDAPGAEVFRQNGLEPTPFRAEALGLTIHLPAGADVQARPIGGKIAYVAADAPQPQFWRMQIETVLLGTPEADSEAAAIADPEAFLNQILARQTNYEVLARSSPRYGGIRGELCYVKRTSPQGEDVVNGWLILPNGRTSFVVMTLSVIPESFERFRPLLERSFATLQIKTEEERSLEQRSRIENGRAFLDSLTPARLRSLVGERQWFRTYRPARKDGSAGEQEVACSVVEVLATQRGALNPARPKEKYTELEREEGLLVRVQGRVIVDARRDVYFDSVASYWMSWDQSREAWSVVGTHRQGEASRTETETGVRTAPKTGEPIPTLTVIGTDPTPYEWDVPDVYLSQALAWLLGRLLPREEAAPKFYSYYFYNARGLKPSITLRYDRWERLEDGSGHWQLATLLSKYQPPDVSVYDADGSLIRRTRPTGEVTEPAAREQILARWRRQGLRTGPSSR